MSAHAAKTETSAVRRCGLIGGSLDRWLDANRLGRPDEGVLPEREMTQRLAGELEGRDRRPVELGLGGTEQPLVVMHLGPQRDPREQSVALRQKPLERARLRVEALSRRAVAAREDTS